MSEPDRARRFRTFGVARRILAFVVTVAGLFAAALASAAHVRVGQYTLLQCVTHNFLEPGGQYQSLRRFREAEHFGDVDVVFLGSSHAYRGFDPRIFEAEGYRAFNLGSTNQTPLNGYFLARRFLPKLTPELVVIEVYPHTLTTDGLESCRDLTVNTAASWSTLEMAVATRNLGAMTFSLAKNLGLAADDAKAEQAPVPDETYVGGGYSESEGHRRELGRPPEPIALDLRSEQLAWLARTTAFARSHGVSVVWVTHPTPVDQRSVITNREAVAERIGAAAAAAGVAYWDFDARVELDPLEDFADLHHLSAAGVGKFNRALLVALRGARYLR